MNAPRFSGPRISKVPTPPEAIQRAALARIDFSDGYRAYLPGKPVTALDCAQAMFAQPPGFVRALMALRNAAVAPFGLKPPERLHSGGDAARVGMFPLLFHTNDEALFGGDDRHLDFRIWIGVSADDAGCRLTLSTLVQLHNGAGRLYLSVVMPFHRLLSRVMLARALRRLADAPRD